MASNNSSDSSDCSEDTTSNIKDITSITKPRKALKLIRNLTLEQLHILKDSFNSQCLRKVEFVQTIERIFENPKFTPHAIELYNEIDANNTDRITWMDFMEFLEDSLQTTTKEIKTSVQVSKIQLVPHTKRETIVKVVLIETENYFCYAMISKHGRVGLYDGNFDFLTTYYLIMTREDIHRTETERRKRNRWVTDAIFAQDVQMFFVTNSTRSIVIYDASGLNHLPIYLILTTPNIVQCFAYKQCDSDGKPMLFMGDSEGKVLAFQFQQAKSALFRKKYSDKLNLFYWDELPYETDYIKVVFYARPHKDSVRKIFYVRENDSLLSCSNDFDTALIRRSVRDQNKQEIFKIRTGVCTFALSNFLKILITGSKDGLIRLWNPLINTKPISVFKKHQSEIVDVKIIEKQNIFLSCSRDGALNLWDLEEQKCIQSLTINFPSFSIFGKTIEWGNECLYPGPKCYPEGMNYEPNIWERPQFLVMCCNYMAVMKIFFKSGNKNINLPILPPPPLQNSVLVPKSWNQTSKIEQTSLFNDQKRDLVDEAKIQERIKELSFILDKDLFADGGRSDINFKIAALERKKLNMQENVALGAPYLALDLFEVDTIKLSPDLPVPNRKFIRNIAESTRKILVDAKARDLVFSESSSRSSKSSRSSIVEFEL